MKKLLLLSCISALTITTGFAQRKKDVQTDRTAIGTPFHKGSNTLAFGVGFGIDYYSYGSIVNRTPSILAYFDHGIIDNVGPGNIGIGGIIAYKAYRYERPGEDATASNVIVGLRGTWHLTLLANKNNKFDPYAGAMAGLRFHNYNDPFYNNNNNPYDDDKSVYPTAGLFVGAKYNFVPNFGVWSELGFDVALFKLGINFNF